jgi:hypothetical protein
MPKRDLIRRIDLRPQRKNKRLASNVADKTEEPEVPTTGGGKHQVHFGMILPIVVVPPGPCNITGDDFTILAVKITTDDTTIAGSLGIGTNSYAFSPTHSSSGLTDTWADGTTMLLSFDDVGSDGSYLAIDIAVE